MTWALRAADIWEFKTIILFEAIFKYYNPLAIELSYFAEHCVIWRGVWVRQFFRFFAAVAVWGLTGCVWGQAGTSPTDRTVSPPAVELSTNLREVSQWPEKAPNCFQGGEGLSDLLWTLHCETLQRFVASSTKDLFVENKPHASEHRTESRIWKIKNSYRIFLDSVTNIFRTIDTWVNSV